MSMEKHGGIISTGKTNSSNKALWQSHQQSSVSEAKGTGEENYGFFLIKYLFHTSKSF
jgi:hypothetical protein